MTTSFASCRLATNYEILVARTEFLVALVTRKAQFRTLIRAPDQILDRFYVISMEFLSLRRRHLSFEMSLAARSKDRWLYSQASLLTTYQIAPQLNLD